LYLCSLHSSIFLLTVAVQDNRLQGLYTPLLSVCVHVFEVNTDKNIHVFWDVTLCHCIHTSWHSERLQCFYHQGPAVHGIAGKTEDGSRDQKELKPAHIETKQCTWKRLISCHRVKSADCLHASVISASQHLENNWNLKHSSPDTLHHVEWQ
jgi:hypothetical protein